MMHDEDGAVFGGRFELVGKPVELVALDAPVAREGNRAVEHDDAKPVDSRDRDDWAIRATVRFGLAGVSLTIAKHRTERLAPVVIAHREDRAAPAIGRERGNRRADAPIGLLTAVLRHIARDDDQIESLSRVDRRKHPRQLCCGVDGSVVTGIVTERVRVGQMQDADRMRHGVRLTTRR